MERKSTKQSNHFLYWPNTNATGPLIGLKGNSERELIVEDSRLEGGFSMVFLL